jgi:uncharacterized membrane protein
MPNRIVTSTNIVKSLIFIFIIMFFLDIIVLTLLKPLWQSAVFKIQKKPLNINYTYGFIAYIFLVLGLYYNVYRYINKSNWKMNTLMYGFMYGFFVYGTFDFTNLALFNDYPLGLGIMDTIWGGILMALTSFFTYYLIEIKEII